MKRIDLHGLNINKASAVVLNALYEFKQINNWDDRLQIVTGNGTGSLKFLVEEILEKENCNWDYGNNQCSVFIVYK